MALAPVALRGRCREATLRASLDAAVDPGVLELTLSQAPRVYAKDLSVNAKNPATESTELGELSTAPTNVAGLLVWHWR